LYKNYILAKILYFLKVYEHKISGTIYLLHSASIAHIWEVPMTILY